MVGGSVRNMVLRHKPTDFDFATDADPKQVMKLFRTVIPTGIKHGTVTVLFQGHQFEVTTFRVESSYSNARHPDSVEFTPSLDEDLKRRDFSINAMAVDLVHGHLHDPQGGQEDLRKGLIRAIGNPEERFREDGLRLMRACRFAAQLEFDIEENTFLAMKAGVETITQVSAERIREEFLKMLAAERPSVGLQVMNRSGLLEILLPELDSCRGVVQGQSHAFDVFEHSLLCCDGAPRTKPLVRLAALFHDLGKSRTKEVDEDGDFSFHQHEIVSEEMVRQILRRYRFSRQEESKVCLLVRNHMFNYHERWSDGAVRRFIARVGLDNMEDLFDLRRADLFALQGRLPLKDGIEGLRDRIEQVVQQQDALSVKDLEINGHILQKKAGIPKGPDMGTVMDYLLESVMDDPQLNSEEKLLRIAKNFYEGYLPRR